MLQTSRLQWRAIERWWRCRGWHWRMKMISFERIFVLKAHSYVMMKRYDMWRSSHAEYVGCKQHEEVMFGGGLCGVFVRDVIVTYSRVKACYQGQVSPWIDEEDVLSLEQRCLVRQIDNDWQTEMFDIGSKWKPGVWMRNVWEKNEMWALGFQWRDGNEVTVRQIWSEMSFVSLMAWQPVTIARPECLNSEQIKLQMILKNIK